MEADILSNMSFLTQKNSLPHNPNPSLQIRILGLQSEPRIAIRGGMETEFSQSRLGLVIRVGMEVDILSHMHFLNQKKSLPQNPNPSLQIRILGLQSEAGWKRIS
jgi:hypothetical protein